MTTFRTSSPPRVSIPEEVWNSGSLAPYIARLAVEHGPIYSFVPQAGPLAGHPAVYLVGPEANRFVLLSGRTHFSHDLGWTPVVGESLGHGLLNMDPPEHTRHRGLMNPAFTASFMAGYLPLMERVIAERTAGWAERAEVDLALEAREITFDVAAAALVGAQTGPQVDWLRKRFYILLHGPDPGSYRDWDDAMQQVIQVRQELQGALLELERPPGRLAPQTVLHPAAWPGPRFGSGLGRRDAAGHPGTPGAPGGAARTDRRPASDFELTRGPGGRPGPAGPGA